MKYDLEAGYYTLSDSLLKKTLFRIAGSYKSSTFNGMGLVRQ